MVACLFLLANTKTFSQINPSIYIGIGTPNLGGVLGMGSEIKYNCFSVSAAIGMDVFSEHDFNFDIGVKIYSNDRFFGGLNYGHTTSRGGWFNSENDYYGFTFSMGYRRTFYKHLYGMVYLGATSDYLTFMPKSKKEKAILPRFGLIFGYEF